MKSLAKFFVSPNTKLRDVLVRSEEIRRGIIMVVDDARHLLGVITDGDIRRAFLVGTDLNINAGDFIKSKGILSRPITASVNIKRDDLIKLLQETGVSHIPLVNIAEQVERLVCIDDLIKDREPDLQAVVMAGGRGIRLRPLTENTPKPMLQVGNRPLMERIIRQLSESGIRQISVTTHYHAKKISDYFGDGKNFGVEINYIAEDQQLGTAGGLSFMPEVESALLVVNGDILTDVDFRVMRDFHCEHNAALTIAVRQYELQVPYGVVETQGVYVSRLIEKPKHKFFVNAGIYLLEPRVLQLIPKGQHFDMTDLIRESMSQSMNVVSFPVLEYWRDIGQHKDYVQAQVDLENGTLLK